MLARRRWLRLQWIKSGPSDSVRIPQQGGPTVNPLLNTCRIALRRAQLISFRVGSEWAGDFSIRAFHAFRVG